MNGIKSLDTDERKLLIFVISMWGINLFGYIKAILERIPGFKELTDFFLPTVVLCLILYSNSPLLRKIKIIDYAFVLFSVVVYFFYYILYPQNSELLENNASMFLFGALPFYFVGLVFDAKKHLPYLEIVSIVSIILGVLYMNYKASTGLLGDGDTTENMARAYAYLPHALLLLHTTIRQFKRWRLLFLILSIFIILGAGNRGTILVISLCTVLELLLIRHYRKPVFTRILIVVLAIVVYIIMEPLLDYLFDIMERVGFSSRTLTFLEGGDFIADTNGRDVIASRLTRALATSPIFGYGLCGDRLIAGTYAHNLLLEFLVSFGPLIGSVFFIMVVYLIIKGYVRCKNEADKGLWIVLIGYGFISLFISESFLNTKFFFMMLGYCIALIRTSRSNIIIESVNRKTA